MATAQTFGLVLLGLRMDQRSASLRRGCAINHSQLQTMLFLQLAAGGHMLLFVVRARSWAVAPPWPSKALFFAIVATQIVAVLMCAYGVLVPALPWAMIGVVWAYVIAWTILTDIVKLIFNAIYAKRERVTPLTAHAAPIG